MMRSLVFSLYASAAACSVITGCSTLPVAGQAAAESVATKPVPAFDRVMIDLAAGVDARLLQGVPVPVPVDAGGGYTHEQHKQNGKTIYEAGLLYSHTGEETYLGAVRDILFDYADLYPGLGVHPKRKEQTPGRLFWQSLNESVWLVYAIQGYEQVRADLTAEDRARIEDKVLNPMADFLSIGSADTFNRIHNHGTWAAAAVGMTGYVLEQPNRVEQALLGLDKPGQGGFLKQLDILFSPDGYYAEGPYYQRYALMPFVLFAQAIEKNEPERKIFEHRDGILMKAIRSTVALSYAGKFFPINDAIREKGLNTVELKYGLAIAYDLTKDPRLLGAVSLQNGVVPTPEGAQLLSAIAQGEAEPFAFSSELLRDGSTGTEGALAILRSGPGQKDAAVIMKATSQGLNHGHFDKLGLLYFDNGAEIVADYGAARFLNVEPKYGGHYLPENETWAKQSIAHNTLVVDEASHFSGDWHEGQKHAPNILAFDNFDGVQVAFAEISTAYDDVRLERLVGLFHGENGRDYVVDIMRGIGRDGHRFDLPVHFKGQLIETSFDMDHSTDRLEPLGLRNGYQHLWKRSESEVLGGLHSTSWLLGDQFYTLSFAADQNVTAYFTELGANDPDHNLRREQALILRTHGRATNYVSIYERHGRYDSDEEITVFDGSSIEAIEIVPEDGATAFTIRPASSAAITFRLADHRTARERLQVVRHETNPDIKQKIPGEGHQ